MTRKKGQDNFFNEAFGFSEVFQRRRGHGKMRRSRPKEKNSITTLPERPQKCTDVASLTTRSVSLSATQPCSGGRRGRGGSSRHANQLLWATARESHATRGSTAVSAASRGAHDRSREVRGCRCSRGSSSSEGRDSRLSLTVQDTDRKGLPLPGTFSIHTHQQLNYISFLKDAYHYYLFSLKLRHNKILILPADSNEAIIIQRESWWPHIWAWSLQLVTE